MHGRVAFLRSFTAYRYPEPSEPCVVVFPRRGGNEIRAHILVVDIATRWLPVKRVCESEYAPSLVNDETRLEGCESELQPRPIDKQLPLTATPSPCVLAFRTLPV